MRQSATRWLAVLASVGCAVGMIGVGCNVSGDQVGCPRGWEEVERCPENEECKEVQTSTGSVVCKRLTCDTRPECPEDSVRTDECYTGERCFLQQRCGDAVLCRERQAAPCNHDPVCPRRSERVRGCPEGALCFEVRRCGSSITCEDQTAD